MMDAGFSQDDGWSAIPEEMLPKEALAALKALASVTDTEAAHGQADEILCSLLRFLGQEDVVEAYEKIDKWYT